MKQITRILCIGLLTLGVAACTKENPKPTNPDTPDTPATPETTTDYALVLNEGSWSGNNASLTLFDIADGTVASDDWFSEINGRGLGDVAQDMVAYGSKVYVTVWNSNSLEVIDPKTGNSQRVDMGTRGPRSIAADGGKLYISCYSPHSVVRIDTASLQIEATCELGEFQPEGIAACNGKLFVASSFIQDGQNYLYDDKVYVIDQASFENPEPIIVGSNPQKVLAMGNGKLIVSYSGNYAEAVAGSAIIDANTLAVTQTEQALAGMDVYNGTVYGYAVAYDDQWNETYVYKTITADLTVSDLPFAVSTGTEGTYGISINPANGDLYLMGNGNYQYNGTVYCYSQNGTLRYTFEAGMNPKKILFQ